MNKTKGKTDLAGLVKKHPKELAITGAAGIVLVLALKKKSSGGIAPAGVDTSGGGSAGGNILDPGAMDGASNLNASIAALNAKIDSISALNSQPVGVVSPTPSIDVAAQLSTMPVSVQGLAPVAPAITTPTPTPVVPVTQPFITTPTPTPVVPVVTQPAAATASPFSIEREWIRPATVAQTPVAQIRPTSSVQGLLGVTKAPRTARGD